jgi:glycosyltransferase involved in cell wall biosynthesis
VKLSISIISFNEESNIERTLLAVKPIADEIIIVDSHSTDRTVEIAESLGAKVFSEPWKGHIAQKNSALEKCSGDWVLCVDSDEELTEAARESIMQLIDRDENTNGYAINRCTFYMGKLLKHSWQPDHKLRLVRRSASPYWGGYDPHDVLMVKGKTGKIQGSLTHYSYKDFSDHMQRTIQHACWTAISYHKKGKKCGALALLTKPPFAFVKMLIFQRSILDGMPGVVAATSAAVYAYMKYSFLYELGKAKDIV